MSNLISQAVRRASDWYVLPNQADRARAIEQARTARWQHIIDQRDEPPLTTVFRHHNGWHCSSCEAYNHTYMDKFYAAFESVRDRTPMTCVACGSENDPSWNGAGVMLDRDILMYWLDDEDAYLSLKDEDLHFARFQTEDLLAALKAKELAFCAKTHVLTEAVMVKYRNGRRAAGKHPSERIKYEIAACETWLLFNRERWDCDGVWDYLRADVRRSLKVG